MSRKPFTQKQVIRALLLINAVVENEGKGSAYNGLTLLAHAFGGLLDVYAQPNERNDQGMCDSPRKLREHFAEMIANGPILRKKVFGERSREESDESRHDHARD